MDCQDAGVDAGIRDVAKAQSYRAGDTSKGVGVSDVLINTMPRLAKYYLCPLFSLIFVCERTFQVRKRARGLRAGLGLLLGAAGHGWAFSRRGGEPITSGAQGDSGIWTCEGGGGGYVGTGESEMVKSPKVSTQSIGSDGSWAPSAGAGRMLGDVKA